MRRKGVDVEWFTWKGGWLERGEGAKEEGDLWMCQSKGVKKGFMSRQEYIYIYYMHFFFSGGLMCMHTAVYVNSSINGLAIMAT